LFTREISEGIEIGYPSDLTDNDWEIIKRYFGRSDPRGAVSKHDKRNIVNAILYVTRGGIQWRMLPTDFPPWPTVYDHYRNWCLRGVWKTVLEHLNRLLSKLRNGVKFAANDWRGPEFTAGK
jgi:transposase